MLSLNTIIQLCKIRIVYIITAKCLYPRHTGGAVPLRFLVKTATTVSVVFHSFPDEFFFAVLLCNKGGITVVSLRTWRSH